jgi:hypothetical protein
LHLVGILFPHINDDARSKSHQISNNTTQQYFIVKITGNNSRSLNNLLLSSAIGLWVLACSTIVEYSQQEGFYRVPLPAARQTTNLEDQ